MLPGPPEATPVTAPNPNLVQFKERLAKARDAGFSWDSIGQAVGQKITEAKQAGFTDQAIAASFGARDPAELQQLLSPLLTRGAVPNFDENGWSRDVRQQYAHAVNAGHVQDGDGFLSRLGHEIAYGEGPTSWLYRGYLNYVAKPFYTANEAIGEAAMPFAGMAPGSLGPAGAIVGPVAGAVGKAASTIGKLGAKLPSAQDFLDGAIALQRTTKGKVAEDATATVERNLTQHWVETGEEPAAVAERAQHDPVLRSSLLAPDGLPVTPPGSSVTQTAHGEAFVIPRQAGHVFASPEAVPQAVLDTFYKLEGSGEQAVSPRGAIGRGQIMPATAKQYGFDPQLLHNPAYNEQVTRTILADLSRRYHGDMDAMAVAYNAGPGAADKWLEAGRQVTSLPQETQRYLARLHGMQAGGGEPPAMVDLSKYAVGNAVPGGPSSVVGVHPEFARRIENMVEAMPPEIREKFAITSGFRSAEREAQVYAEQHPGQAVPRDSYHSHGMAVDTTTNPEVLAWINANGERYGVGYTLKHQPGEANHLEPTENGMRVPPENVAHWAGGGSPPHEPPLPPGGTPEDADPIKAMLSRIDNSKPSALDRLKDGWSNFYREMFRGDHPLVKLQDAIEKGGPIPDAENPRFLRRLAESDATAKYAVERGIYDVETGEQRAPAMVNILPKTGKEYEEFKGYSIARWAVEKAGQTKETGVDIDKAKQAVALLDDKYRARFDDLVAFQNGTLDWLRRGHIISDEAFERMVAENKARIPGYRADDEAFGSVRGAGHTVYNPVKEFIGSDRKIDDPFNSILNDTFARAQLMNKAIADRAMVDAAAPAGLATKTGTHTFKFDLTPAEIAKLGSDIGEDDGAAIFRRLATGLRQDEVPIFRDGKMEAWTFADPDVAKVMRGMDSYHLALFQKMMAPMVRFFRGATVLNPLFPVRLLTYDVPWQFITKPGFRNTVADVLTGLRHIVSDSPAYDAYLASGTAERVFGGVSRDAYIRDILRSHGDPMYTGVADAAYNVVRTPLQGLRAWSALVTQPQRVGRFVRGLEAGESELRAGTAATEAAFHRSGFGGPASRAMNVLHPFLAAQLNGLEQMTRAQFGIGKTVLGEAYKPAEFTAKALALVTLPILSNWYLAKDEEWYKAAPRWQKNSGLLFHTGGEDGTTFYVPLPPLLGFVYGGLPRMLLEKYVEGNPHALDSLGTDLAVNLIPGGMRLGVGLAQTVEPVIEHMANHSFFKGRPLVSDHAKANLPPEQGSQWSSGAARALSQFTSDMPLLHGMNLSPQAIDNYIQGWGGTLGTAATRAADLVLGTGPHGATGPAPGPPTIADWPLVSSWMARYPSAQAQPIQDFYDSMTGFHQAQSSILTATSEGHLDRVEQLVREHPAAGVWILSHPDVQAKIGIAMQTPETLNRFQNIIAQASSHLSPAQQQDLQAVMTADAAMRQQHILVERVQKDPKMPVADKQQLLDRYYAGMQLTAERTLPAMHRLGIE